MALSFKVNNIALNLISRMCISSYLCIIYIGCTRD